MTEGKPMDKSFSRGNFWSIIATILTALTIGGGVLMQQTQFNSKNDENTRNINLLQSAVSTNSRAIQSLEVNSARTNAQFEALSESLTEMRGELREITRLLRDELRKR